jgi:hypothetical protein
MTNRVLFLGVVVLAPLLVACSGAQDPAPTTLSPLERELGCDLNAYVEDPGVAASEPAKAVEAKLDQWRTQGYSLTAREYSGTDQERGLKVYLVFQADRPWGTVEVQGSGATYTARDARRCAR